MPLTTMSNGTFTEFIINMLAIIVSVLSVTRVHLVIVGKKDGDGHEVNHCRDTRSFQNLVNLY